VTTVLVVDDEPQIFRALRLNLTARSYVVVTETTGRHSTPPPGSITSRDQNRRCAGRR
jgi:CheY-like chemotaxis protein